MGNERFFSLVSLNNVVVTDEYDELMDCLCFWPDERCEAFGAESLEEANVLAVQTYAARFFGHPAHFGRVPMALPDSGCYALTAPAASIFPNVLSHQRNLPSANNPSPQGLSTFEQGAPIQFAPIMPNTANVTAHGGAWSIVGVNMCSVTENPEDVAVLLANETVVYPHATCWSDIAVAVRWTQYEYAKRVATRYDYRSYYPTQMSRMPLVGEKFSDSQYEEREHGFSDNPVMQKLRGFGLI